MSKNVSCHVKIHQSLTYTSSSRFYKGTQPWSRIQREMRLISSFCVLLLILGCSFAVVEELNAEDLLKIVNGEVEDNWFIKL